MTRMTALEYMEKKVQKHSQNFEREFKRGVPDDQLEDIMAKIRYYKAACAALQREQLISSINVGCTPDECKKHGYIHCGECVADRLRRKVGDGNA